jgi:ATP-dependent helicase HrpB
MMELPVARARAELLAALGGGGLRRAVLQAPTGSGKSTLVPGMLLDEGLAGEGQVVVLEPRRLAARMLAGYVARQRGGRVGEEVGYQVRHENVTSGRTRLRYVTEGLLLRQLMGDRELGGVSWLVFDEFHERNLDADLCLALARELQEGARPDLGVLVMSATLDAGGVADYLGGAPVITAEGRSYPVDISYQRVREAGGPGGRRGVRAAIWDEAARAARGLLGGGGDDGGDLLFFLPGAYEIRKTIEVLSREPNMRGWEILPLYGDLPPAKQDLAVTRREGVRRAIVSTNVAETSLTIEGVTGVIDAGLVREAAYDRARGFDTLLVKKISRASADQRAGRAGRLAPGRCVRLWGEHEQLQLAAQGLPEVARVDLAGALLALAAMGVRDARQLAWYQAPPEGAIAHGIELLRDLGAIDGDGLLTGAGRRMAEVPAHPRLARFLMAVESESVGHLPLAALMVALLEGRSLFGRGGKPESFALRGDRSDFQVQLRAWVAAASGGFDGRKCGAVGLNGQAGREAMRVAEQHLRAMGKGKGNLALPRSAADWLEHIDERLIGDFDHLARALLAAYPDRVARELSAGARVYGLTGGRRAKLGADVAVRAPELLVAAELLEVEGRELQVRLGKVTAVEEAWLGELFPGSVKVEDSVEYEAMHKRIARVSRRLFRDLELGRKEGGEPEAGAAAAVLARLVERGEISLKKWDEGVEQWVARLNGLAVWMPELELPALDGGDRLALIEQIAYGHSTLKQMREAEVWPSLEAWLTAVQRADLERLAPKRVRLSNGLEGRLIYRSDQPELPPRLPMVLQQLYDVVEVPRIAGGRVTVLVEILGPNRRPVQLTDNLGRFWRESYEGVKKQLKGRYPKHEWR